MFLLKLKVSITNLWHENCDRFFWKPAYMATKMNTTKLLQEIRGFAEIANRRPQPKPPGLFLMQIRPHVLRPVMPKRKLEVHIEMQALQDVPHPVRITHVKETALPPTTLSAS